MILRIKSDTTANETDYFKGRPQDFAQQSSIPGSASFLPNCLAFLTKILCNRPPRLPLNQLWTFLKNVTLRERSLRKISREWRRVFPPG